MNHIELTDEELRDLDSLCHTALLGGPVSDGQRAAAFKVCHAMERMKGRGRREEWRNPACVEAWPECETFGYDPRCCRFPKSCSAGIRREPVS